MANSNIPLLSGVILYTDSSSTGTAVVVKASSTVLYELELDNTANAAAASYTKLWNTGTVTVGTTVPDYVFMIPAATKITIVLPSGVTLATAMTVATTTAGGTVGSSSPASAVAIKLVYV